MIIFNQTLMLLFSSVPKPNQGTRFSPTAMIKQTRTHESLNHTGDWWTSWDGAKCPADVLEIYQDIMTDFAPMECVLMRIGWADATGMLLFQNETIGNYTLVKVKGFSNT